MKRGISIKQELKPMEGLSVSDQAANVIAAQIAILRADKKLHDARVLFSSRVTQRPDGTGYVEVEIRRRFWFSRFDRVDAFFFIGIILVQLAGSTIDGFGPMSFAVGVAFGMIAMRLREKSKKKGFLV